MPRIKTKELIERIENGNYKAIRLRALHGGTFCMLLEDADEVFIHENLDGRIKEYPQASHALTWLKGIMDVEKVFVDASIRRS
ncbi:MAG: hypothetical protein M3525_00820 [Acidobacteriota bacterium]|nr:hypothetical protein [Acidobacteriota bacterium]